MFYTFEQNNSGGLFKGSETIIVEADSAEEANDRAEMFGVYFDGVYRELDCRCCGDRWSKCTDDKGTEKPEINGKEVFEDEICKIYYKRR